MKREQAVANLENLLKLSVQLHRLNREIEEIVNISLVQTLVLIKLKDLPGVSALGLSQQVGVHPSTLTPMLKRLEKLEYIFLAQDPKDSRKTLIALSRKGKVTLDKALGSLTDILYEEHPRLDLIQSVDYLNVIRRKIEKSKENPAC